MTHRILPTAGRLFRSPLIRPIAIGTARVGHFHGMPLRDLRSYSVTKGGERNMLRFNGNVSGFFEKNNLGGLYFAGILKNLPSNIFLSYIEEYVDFRDRRVSPLVLLEKAQEPEVCRLLKSIEKEPLFGEDSVQRAKVLLERIEKDSGSPFID